MALLNYIETPIQEIHGSFLEEEGIRILVKREDLNHPNVSGNKWWKLKYNLEEAVKRNFTTLLTYGGAYSNHIYATAAAARETGLKSIGIIRGEETLPLNSTLSFAREQGMELEYLSRDKFRQKKELGLIENLKIQFGEFYLIPEGGTNLLALKGCEELAKKIMSEVDFDYLCLPVGTGGTMAGVIAGLRGEKEVVGFSVLKGGSFLKEEVSSMLKDFTSKDPGNWKIETDYHFGGYGKGIADLHEFVSEQWLTHKLPLDPVYTAKLVFGVFDLIKKKKFRKGSTLLLLHTGGLQGKLL